MAQFSALEVNIRRVFVNKSNWNLNLTTIPNLKATAQSLYVFLISPCRHIDKMFWWIFDGKAESKPFRASICNKNKYNKLFKEKYIMEIECMGIYVMVTNFSGLEILLNQFFQLSLQPLSGKLNGHIYFKT